MNGSRIHPAPLVLAVFARGRPAPPESAMCGRFTQTAGLEELARFFRAEAGAVGAVPPRWNLAPSQEAVLVVGDAATPERRRLVLASWGFVPAWSRTALTGARPINARIETAHEKPFYRDALVVGRALVPCDGFYEWKAPEARQDHRDQLSLFDESVTGASAGARRRRTPGAPWFLRARDGRPFALAALVAEHASRGETDASPALTFSILTTRPNELLAPLHDRMPVIVPSEHWDLWLGRTPLSDEERRRLAEPYPAEEMEGWPVERHVNDAGAEGALLANPIA